jgi:hypothetical protein
MTWTYGLTGDEWLHLASEGEESEVQPCCGNISQMRELLMAITTCQASYDRWMRASLGKQLFEALEADGDGHNLQDEKTFPILHRVLAGLREDIKNDHL